MVSSAVNLGLDLAEEIAELKRERNAVILAHNYQVPEMQDIADYVGDSLGLSYKARETDADVILFCGVHFMAETAKIINPTKRVLLPDLDAGCSLSESCPPEKLAAFLQEHAEKNYYVIAYINCSAGVKALSDVICTSGNAEKIVRRAPPDRNILFVPDQNLGAWVIEKTGRPMDLWQGNCYVHVEFTARSIRKIHEEYPDAPVVAHPECPFAVRLLADEVCSTEKMVDYSRQSPARDIIVVTEAGMLHRLKKEVPEKNFIPGPTDRCACAECRFMKMNTLEKAHAALLNLPPEITVARAAAETRGGADFAHAGVEQVAARIELSPAALWRGVNARRGIRLKFVFAAVPSYFQPQCSGLRHGSCSSFCCSAFCSCANRVSPRLKKSFSAGWCDTRMRNGPIPLTVIEIGADPLMPKREAAAARQRRGAVSRQRGGGIAAGVCAVPAVAARFPPGRGGVRERVEMARGRQGSGAGFSRSGDARAEAAPGRGVGHERGSGRALGGDSRVFGCDRKARRAGRVTVAWRGSRMKICGSSRRPAT